MRQSTRWLPTSVLSTTERTGSRPTCASPPTAIWCACTTGGSTGRRTGVAPCRRWSLLTSSRWTLVHGGGRALDREEPDHLAVGDHQVLTLARLLELVVNAPRPIELAIETKHPTRYAGLVERRLIETLAQVGLAAQAAEGSGQVRVMSFSEVALRRVRRLAPGVPMVLLMERVPVSYRLGSLPRGVAVAGLSIEIVRAHPKFVHRLHAQGHGVHVWTVDDADDIDLVARLGVDAIITNRPREVLQQLQTDGGLRPRAAGRG